MQKMREYGLRTERCEVWHNKPKNTSESLQQVLMCNWNGHCQEGSIFEVNLLAGMYFTSHKRCTKDGAQMSLENFGCTYQPDLFSSMAATIKPSLSDTAISLSLRTPVSTHPDSLVFNVERAAGPDHKIMLTFHRVWNEQEKWVHDTYFVTHTKWWGISVAWVLDVDN